MTNLVIYYEGGTRDRFWLAPAGLGLEEAWKQREGGKSYKIREGARRGLLAIIARRQQEEGQP
jgi:hypothetical protein